MVGTIFDVEPDVSWVLVAYYMGIELTFHRLSRWQVSDHRKQR